MGNIILSGAYDTAFEEIEKKLNDCRKEKMLVVDVGANIGIFSAICQGVRGQNLPCKDVIVIEPDEENFKLLQQNTKTERTVACILGGLWGHSGTLKIDNKQDRKCA